MRLASVETCGRQSCELLLPAPAVPPHGVLLPRHPLGGQPPGCAEGPVPSPSGLEPGTGAGLPRVLLSSLSGGRGLLHDREGVISLRDTQVNRQAAIQQNATRHHEARPHTYRSAHGRKPARGAGQGPGELDKPALPYLILPRRSVPLH